MALAEIGERQKKFVDAKQYLQQVAKQRQARGEPQAAAEAILRLGSLEGADFQTKMAAAQAAQQLGDAYRAVELLKEMAQTLEKEHKRPEALRLLAEAAELDPFDAELRDKLAREFVSSGQPERARAYLSFETAGDDPDLLLALATIEFAAGRDDDARVAMGRVLALAPAREPDIVTLADDLAVKGRIDSAYSCIDAITDAALLQGKTERAVEVLRTFADRSPHIPALAKLIEISVEANMANALSDAQACLVDAYLDASRGDEARAIAEDLVRADPANDTHASRLRRAFELLGERDLDAAVQRVRSVQVAEPEHTETFEVPEIADAPSLPDVDIFVYPERDIPVVDPDVPEPSLAAPVPNAAARPSPLVDDAAVHDLEAGEESTMLELTEIDLSSALSGLMSSSPASPVSTTDGAPEELSESFAAEPVPDVPNPDIEDVFARMRAKAAREQQASTALAQYEEALQFIQQGLDKEAITALEAAARVPMLRFKAAAQLGRLLIDRGDLNEGVEWLERAAEAPAPTPDEGYELLYELAGALEAQGESARALAILMELDAESDGYRDVRIRIMHLSRAQTGSSRP
jgi:tetratricopeptide (TPR) repeat protein